MNRFADLIDRLSFEPQRSAKVALVTDYLRLTPDPDRGLGLAALCGALRFKSVKPGTFKQLVETRVDADLFRLSYDFVGDLAETIALIWPAQPGGAAPSPSLATIAQSLEIAPRADVPRLIETWLNSLDAKGRYALIKSLSGGMRIGLSARLAKLAVANLGAIDIADIEDLWHSQMPPYQALLHYAEGMGPRPQGIAIAPFRPVMLAHPLNDGDINPDDLSAYRAEWKWDGVRVQWVNEGGAVKIYTRTGEDLTAAFPDLCAPMPSSVSIDGELLIRTDDGSIRPFSQLQSRLNRKRATAALLAESPAHIRAYDILHADGQDLRDLGFDQRRMHLEAFLAQTKPPRFDLSPLLSFSDWASLEALRQAAPDHAEGLMLKRADSPYLGGRPKGHWFKWKRAPLEADAVLMYAQRGHGRRSSQFSDFTFGVWREGELVPIGKAYFGFSDAELKLLDKFVRDHTIDRFGPVRVIAHKPDLGLVVTVHFDGIQRSKRHKSGLALRFPRIGRIRWDKLPKDADHLATIELLMAHQSS